MNACTCERRPDLGRTSTVFTDFFGCGCRPLEELSKAGVTGQDLRSAASTAVRYKDLCGEGRGYERKHEVWFPPRQGQRRRRDAVRVREEQDRKAGAPSALGADENRAHVRGLGARGLDDAFGIGVVSHAVEQGQARARVSSDVACVALWTDGLSRERRGEAFRRRTLRGDRRLLRDRQKRLSRESRGETPASGPNQTPPRARRRAAADREASRQEAATRSGERRRARERQQE